MATIIEPTGFEEEERVGIPVQGIHCKAISGYTNFFALVNNNIGGPSPGSSSPQGDPGSDTKWVAHTIHMVVGPRWRAVRDVSPIVNLAGHVFDDSDEADDSGFHIDTCTWDTVGLPPPDTDFERIRLKIKLRLRGGSGSSVTKLSYQLIANGVAG